MLVDSMELMHVWNAVQRCTSLPYQRQHVLQQECTSDRTVRLIFMKSVREVQGQTTDLKIETRTLRYLASWSSCFSALPESASWE